jgi:hypothetical protein
MQYSERLIDLARHRLGSLEQVQQLRIVHLQQHPSDLARQLRLGPIRAIPHKQMSVDA